MSVAPIEEAADAKSWHTTQIDTDGARPLLAADPASGALYISYVVANAQVMLRRSTDGGSSWEKTQTIWSSEAGDHVPYNGSLAVDNQGAAHLGWQVNDGSQNWKAVQIWHARWSPQQDILVRMVMQGEEADPSLAYPSLAVDLSSSRLFLFWDNGVGSQTGRFYQWSDDNGATWSEVHSVFAPELSGITGNAGLAFDSQGTLHVATAAEGPDENTAVRYATWDNASWTPYQSISLLDHPGEHPSLCITGGNVLHLIWNDDYTDGQVIYVTRTAQAPALAPSGFTARSPDEQVPPLPTVIVPASTQSTPTPSANSSSSRSGNAVQQSKASSDGALPIVLSTSLSATLVLFVAVWRINSRRRRG